MMNLNPIKIYFPIILLTCYFIIMTNYAYSEQEQEQAQNNNLYTEILLGDEQLPFILLGREALSSNDILECSANHNQDTHSILQGIIEIENNPEQISTTNDDKSEQEPTTRSFDNLLLGFPFTALNKPLLIGASLTKFSDQDNAHYQTKHYKDIFRDHRFAFLNAKEIQAHLAGSDDGGCFLNLVLCDNRDDCKDKNDQLVFYAQIPVLGISQKHQAVIIDPAFLGNSLSDIIDLFRPNNNSRSMRQETLIPTKDHRSSVVDFSQSTLIFDVVSTLDWEEPPPFAEMTSRWFIRPGLDQEDFINRPPTQRVEYFVVDSFLQNKPVIVTRNISRDKPVKYYVKNMPEEYQDAVREGFEHWNSISINLMGYPIVSYTFIQGDYDG